MNWLKRNGREMIGWLIIVALFFITASFPKTGMTWDSRAWLDLYRFAIIAALTLSWLWVNRRKG